MVQNHVSSPGGNEPWTYRFSLMLFLTELVRLPREETFRVFPKLGVVEHLLIMIPQLRG